MLRQVPLSTPSPDPIFQGVQPQNQPPARQQSPGQIVTSVPLDQQLSSEAQLEQDQSPSYRASTRPTTSAHDDNVRPPQSEASSPSLGHSQGFRYASEETQPPTADNDPGAQPFSSALKVPSAHGDERLPNRRDSQDEFSQAQTQIASLDSVKPDFHHENSSVQPCSDLPSDFGNSNSDQRPEPDATYAGEQKSSYPIILEAEEPLPNANQSVSNSNQQYPNLDELRRNSRNLSYGETSSQSRSHQPSLEPPSLRTAHVVSNDRPISGNTTPDIMPKEFDGYPQIIKARGQSLVPDSQSQQSLEISTSGIDSADQNNSVMPPKPSAPSDQLQPAKQVLSRPFSFMELSPDDRLRPTEELLHYASKTVRNTSHDHSGRPPSPISPQRSSSQITSSTHNQAFQANPDAWHDIVALELKYDPARRSPSQSFQDPNLHDHPAFRLDGSLDHNTRLPTGYYPAQDPLQGSPFPHQQTIEHHSGQAEKPGAAPLIDIKSRSRRSSRSSAFFENLATPTKTEETKNENAPGSQDMTSTVKTPPAGESKARRLSLFRSLSRWNETDDKRDEGRLKAAIPVPSTRDVAQHTEPSRKENSGIESAPKFGSKKLRNRLQRASTSAATEQDQGKKKRFSGLGVSSIRDLYFQLRQSYN